MWGSLYSWPLVAVHAVLLPDGRVMSYGSRNDGTQTANFEVDIWDNADNPGNGHLTLDNGTGTDLFCSSQLLLPPTSATSTPSVFVAGGDTWNGSKTTNGGNNNTNLIDPVGGKLARGSNMSSARWYSTSITLTNGETYIQGGAGGTGRPEVRATNGSFRTLSAANTSSLDFYYPRNFVLPDGRVFGYDSNGAMYFIGTSGEGSVTSAGSFEGQYSSADSSAAMFRPGRILQFGGNSNGAIIIDVTGSSPTVTATQSMSAQRRLASATILADGQVLATGGSRNWNDAATAVNTLEIWNPQTGQWTVGPAAARPRLYHSNALLLPDASVLVTGGGALNPNDAALNQVNAQIYYPPYLFTASGQRAARPAISSAPTWLEIGQTFTVQTDGNDGIGRVVLIKTGSATHNWNMEQRFIDLAFTKTAAGLRVQAPTRAGEATPGFYMLFVFNAAGVPSEAAMLRVGVAANPNPSVAPTLTSPGAQSSTLGTSVNLALQAADPNGDTLTYSATGLPDGLSLDSATGVITGKPTRAGSFDVVVVASDGVNSASASFVWTAKDASALTLDSTPTPVASLSGSNATFTATASGVGVEYQWNFGDGSADTAWSSSGTVGYAYSAPGTYVVTLRVRDAAGTLISRSFLQTVYLAATANAPAASGNLLLETPASGNARLWVVNQDNDSVTAFDAVTRTKLGEVTVGSAPRAIARSAGGQLWVTNQGSATISVIDPASRSVTRTITLPRASQPYGVAVSPVGSLAYVVLGATGQLLKYDTANYTQLASVAVGANTRHVSVSADGTQAFVSRFITPQLPGEATATVSTPADRGGEVVQVATADMTIVRTVVLAHGERADGENQGRGIPNYLAAATISPDGSQAYVPGKLDNIKRGTLRDSQALNFQNTVRAASSRIVLGSSNAASEDLARRVDHDNASLASAATYDRRGTLLFVALETSREVAVVDAHSGRQVMRFDAGRAPQGLALSSDGKTLFVNNFMDRSVTVHDLRPLLDQGLYSVPLVATLQAVATEKLAANVLLGKQFFYDARDTRLSRDRYMSCASCHNDGGHDGRTWDFTGQGEGLRNTVSLRGRAGAQGRLHWSGNFDEVHDFEGQIRALAGGTGLMTDEQYNTGTRNTPLGDKKAGVSTDLDALAAYVASLSTFDLSPLRASDGKLTADAALGRTVFVAQCLACHGGTDYTTSATAGLQNVGTIKSSSGKRLNATLTGIDPPTLRDAWATGPYLHDGSAATLSAAISAHTNLSLTATQLAQVAAFTAQIGSEEASASTVTTSLEAEAGTRTGAARVQTASNASGGRVVGNINNVGDAVQVSLTGVAKAGDATLVIRFANGYSNNRSLSLYVNGTRRQTVTFPRTGGWNTMADTAAITIPLVAGTNTIRIRRDSSDVAAADIDRFTVTRSE